MTHSQAPVQRRSPRRTYAAVLLLLAFVLSACGAEVSTVLRLEEGVKGTRIIAVTLEKEANDAGEISGGFAAVEATARKHLPAELTYDGMVDDGTNVTMKFRLPFESLEDYEAKVSSLLAQDQYAVEPEISILIQDSPLVSGIEVNENFTSSELLGWLSAGLVEDGVIEEANANSVFNSDGSSVVEIGDTTYESSSAHLSISEVTDNGFTTVDVATTINADDTYAQTIRFLSEREMTDTALAQVDEYFKAAGVDGIENNSVGGYQGGDWVVSFAASSLNELNELTTTALGGDSGLTIETNPSETNPTRFRTEVAGRFDCSAICSPSTGSVTHRMETPEDWELSDQGKGVVAVEGNSATTEDRFGGLIFERSVPLTSAYIETSIDWAGSVKQTYTYNASAEAVEQVGDAFEQLLKPADGVGTFEVSEADGQTVYTAAIQGGSIDEFNEKVSQYVPGGSLQLHKPESFSFWTDYAVELALPIGESLLEGGVDTVTSVIKLPFLHNFSTEQHGPTEYNVEGATATADGLGASSYVYGSASGPWLAALILMGVLVLLGFAGIALGIVFRKRVSSGLTNVWGQRRTVVAGARQAATSAREQTMAAAAGSGAVKASSRAESATSGLPPVQFSEADLH